MRNVTVVILFAVMSSSAWAYEILPRHSCYKPNKPFDFYDEWEVQRYQDDIEEYKSCIEDFIDEQNEAIENHEIAIQEAVNEWNNFVNYELN